MIIRMISFTGNGAALSLLIQKRLGHKYQIQNTSLAEYAADAGNAMQSLKTSVQQWTKEAFFEAEAILFIGACGIAVRSIAPLLRGKYQDPAVLVIDEAGKFCISLLSGHVGGANALAQEIAEFINAVPVITTATDIRGCFAIDNYAAEQGLYCEPVQLCKKVSARLLKGQQVAVKSKFIIMGKLPQGLAEQETGEFGIYFNYAATESPFSETLYVIPKIVFLGLGCKKDTSKEAIERVVSRHLTALHIPIQSIAAIASISNKKEEKGLLQFCEEHKLPFQTYTAEELQCARGEFTNSEFVKDTVGVGNVCERAAVLASGGGELILNKTALNGITIAAAIQEWSVRFE